MGIAGLDPVGLEPGHLPLRHQHIRAFAAGKMAPLDQDAAGAERRQSDRLEFHDAPVAGFGIAEQGPSLRQVRREERRRPGRLRAPARVVLSLLGAAETDEESGRPARRVDAEP